MYLPLLAIPIAIAILTQVIKGFVNIASGHTSIRTFFMSGGIPSAHSSFVTSLLTIIALTEGWRSTSFAVAFVLAAIIIHDAIRVRVHIGKNGKAINAILRNLQQNKQHKQLNGVPESLEITGHNPGEVLIGIAIGLIGTYLLYILL